MLKIFKILILFIIYGNIVWAQNAIVGAGFSSGWGGGGCPTGNSNFKFLASGAGSTYFVTTTANGTGNQYWRYGIDWGGTTAQWMASGGSPDLSVTPSTTYSLTQSCTTSGALYYNVPNISYNYVFKTIDAGSNPTGTVVFFEVQGTVQTVSSVTQSPVPAVVCPGAAVVVTANLSGSLSTGQVAYLRYTTNAWSTSTVLTMSGTGPCTATIPATVNTASAVISYYVFTSGPSNVASDGTNADLYTINLNNNSSSNYSYSVQTGWTSAVNGNWGTAATWTANAIPSTTESMGTVTIGHNVTIDQNANFSNITINSGATLQFEQTTARTLTAGGNVTINNGGAFQSNTAGTQTGHVLSVAGNITNDGILDFSTNTNTAAAGVTFIGSSDGTFSGTGATTDIRAITINKGTTSTPVLDVNLSNFSVRGSTSDAIGFLTLTNGTFKISGSNTVSSIIFTSAGYSISATTAIWINNSNFTVTGQAGSPSNAGLVRVSSGSYTVGTGGTRTLTNTGTVTIDGGTLSCSGRFLNSTGSVNISSGTLNIATFSYTNASNAGFEMQTNSNVNISGGTIIFQNANAGAGGDIQIVSGGTKNITGGTFQIGNVSTPATQTFIINSPISIYDIIINATNSPIARLITNNLTVSHDITISSGATLDLATNAKDISVGHNFSNSGTFSPGTRTVTFTGGGTVSGTVGFYNVVIGAVIDFGASSTINGTMTINSGGSINTNPPTYVSGSTLKYNSTGTYGRYLEWSATSGVGYPYHVQISNNTTLDLGNGGTATARQCAGNLLIDNGCTLTMNNGGNQMTASLTVTGDVTIGGGTSGTLVLSGQVGGDLNIKGNFIRSNGATLTANSRAVTFNGSSAQQLTGATTFDYLTLNNATGLTLNNANTVNNQLTLTSGKITLGTNSLTMSASSTISVSDATTYIITNSTGYLIRNSVSGGTDFLFPIGPNSTYYTPATINNANTSDNFSVLVSTTVDNVTQDDTRRVDMQWKIVEAVAGGSASIIKLQWNSANQAASFDPAGTVQIGMWNTSIYSPTDATVSGSNPYLASVSSTISTFNATSPFVVGNNQAFAYTTAADGDWNTPSTWTCACNPPAGSSVLINHLVTVNAAVANSVVSMTITPAKSVTFGASGTLTVKSVSNNGSIIMTAGGVLTIATSGTLTNNSTFTYGSGNVIFAGTGTVSGTITFYKAEIKGGVNFGPTSTINNELKISSGGFINTNPPVYSSGSSLKYNTGGTYARSLEWSATSGAGYPFHVEIMGGTTLDLGNGGASTARQCAGGIVINSGTTFTMATTPMTASLTVLGNVSISGTLTLSTSAGGDLNIGGTDWNRTGTFTHNNRTITFNGASAATINHATTFGYLTIDNNTTFAQEIIVTNTLTINSSKIFTSKAASTLNLTISSGGTISNSGTFAPNDGKVIFPGTGTISGTTIFNNVDLNGGAVDFGSGSTVNGTLTINAGGSVNTNGPAYGTSSLLKYNTGGAYNTGAEWGNGTSGQGVPYNVQTFTASTALTFIGGSARTAQKNITIDAGTSLILSSTAGGDLNVKGDWVNNGTFTHSSRQVTFNGGSAQTIGGTNIFAYIDILNSSGGVSITGNTTQSVVDRIMFSNGVFTIGSGNTLSLSNGCDISRSNGSLSVSSGTLSFNGNHNVSYTATLTTGPEFPLPATTNLRDLTVNISSGTVTLETALTPTVNRNLFITAGTFADAGNTITVKGNITNNGTHSGTGNIVLNSGTAIHILDGTGFYQNLELNDAQNAQLNASCVVNGVFALTTGTLTLGSSNFTIATTGSISGSPSSSNMFISDGTGELRKMYSGTGSYTFPVGTTGAYTPAILNFTSGTFASAWAGMRVTASKHGSNASTTDFLKRYWTVESSGITAFSCDVTFTYISPTDINGTEANLYGARREAGTFWELLDLVNTSNHQITGTISSFGDFTAGEEAALCWITIQDGAWNDPATWKSGSVPPSGSNVFIAHLVSLNTTANNVGLLTVAFGKTLTFGASGAITINGAVNINGTLDMTSGGSLSLGTGSYFKNNGTFTAGAGTVYFLDDSFVYGPNHSTFNNVGVSAHVDFGAGLSTINGILTVNSNGFVINNSPSYGANATLKYNSGGTYNRVIEWNSPANVQVSNNTYLNMNPYGVSFTVSGNLTIDNGSTLDMQNMCDKLYIRDSLFLNGTLKLSTCAGGDFEVKGNWHRTGTLTTNSRMVTFNGTSNQIIFDHTTFDYLKINNSGGSVVTLKTDIAVNINISIENAAILNTSTYKITGTCDFYLNDGGTLKTGWIDAVDGAIATRATGVGFGCIQTSGATRSFSQKATYHFIGADNQKAGNGLPATIDVGGKVIVELTSNTYNFTNSHDENLNTGATLDIRGGTVLDNGNNNFSDATSNNGNLTMSGGIYKFTGSVSFASVVRFPRLTGSYTLTGGTVDLSGTLASGQYQYVYAGASLGVNGYFNLMFSESSVSDGYKIVPSAIVVSNNLNITGASNLVDFLSNGVSGNAGFTMDGGRLRMSKLNTALPELLGISTVYNLTGGVIEFYGSGATQQQQIRGNYDNGNYKISYYDIDINASTANYSSTGTNYSDAGNVDLNSSFILSHQLNVNSPAVLRMDETDYIEGTGNIEIKSGAGLFYGSPNGLKNSGTGISDGNIRISGSRTFSTTASYGFISPGTMNSGDALPVTVVNLYLYKAGATDKVTVNNNGVTISGKLILVNGVLETDNSNLIIFPIGTTVHTNSSGNDGNPGSTTSFVKGPVKKIGNEVFTFPVGDIQGTNYVWAPISISAPSVNTDAFTAQYNFKSANTSGIPTWNTGSNLGSGLDHVSGIEFWNINRDAGTSTPNITAYWKDAVRSEMDVIAGPDYNTGVLADLVIAHWNGTIWENLGASGSTANDDGVSSGKLMGHITNSSSFSSYSPITIGSKTGKNKLPVDLLFFKGNCDHENVALTWATASETNSKFFTIERCIDPECFSIGNTQIIGKINCAGNSNTIINYNYFDKILTNTIYYYRLCQTDFNGDIMYSDIISIECNVSEIPSELPIMFMDNNSNNQLNIELNSEINESAIFTVYDITGKKIISNLFQVGIGLNSFKIDLPSYCNGIYLIALQTKNLNISKKIIVK